MSGAAPDVPGSYLCSDQVQVLLTECGAESEVVMYQKILAVPRGLPEEKRHLAHAFHALGQYVEMREHDNPGLMDCLMALAEARDLIL